MAKRQKHTFLFHSQALYSNPLEGDVLYTSQQRLIIMLCSKILCSVISHSI